jgi:putative DNA primase/helicase
MSSAGAKLSNSVKEFLEQFKPFESSFAKRVDAALYFANKRIRVIPLHTVKNGICTCRKAEKCGTPGKHPMLKNWQKEATTDPEEIRNMWLANPFANIGLAMGKGLVGIDIDVKNDKNGWKEWQRILRQHNSDQIISLIQATPSGGLHIILMVKDSSIITGAADALGTGIDIRSDGNLLVGGGSQNDKGFYRSFDLPIATAPYWLETLLIERANWIKPILKRISTGVTFNQGERNKACVAYCVYLNRQGLEKYEFAQKMREFANTQCIPPYEDPAVDYMIEHYYNPRSADVGGTEIPAFEDLGKPYFKIWEIPEEKVRTALTVLYEYVPHGSDEIYELAKRNLPNMLMQYLKHQYHVAREITFGKPQDTLHWYNGRYYETEPTNLVLREKMEHLTSNQVTNGEKSEVLIKLMDNAYLMKTQERYLALENGLLDCEKLKVIDFTPEIFATVLLPAKYLEDNSRPIFDKFLSEVASQKDIKRLQEWAGYTLIPGYPVKKGLILIGPTDSGKSTFLQAIKEILGIQNVSAATLQQLSTADQRFITSKLYKKLVNIAPDMPTSSLSDISIFKGITGRDLIPGEFKYKHPFDFQPRSKLLFSANSLPSVSDEEDAFFNRWDIIVFHKPPSIDARLQEKLKEESSGILNWMIEGAKRIMENGLKFTDATPTAEAIRIWTRSANPVRAFFNECIAKEGNEERTASDFYDAYKRYAERYHLKLLDEDIFDITFSKVSKTNVIKRQRNNVAHKYRKGLRIQPPEDWPEPNFSFSAEDVGPEIDPEVIFERVSKVFAGISEAARDRDNIERWIASEKGISVDTVQTIIDKWISEGLVIPKGRCLEFPERDNQNA